MKGLFSYWISVDNLTGNSHLSKFKINQNHRIFSKFLIHGAKILGKFVQSFKLISWCCCLQSQAK